MEAQGLYDPQHEHDACGVGFVVDIKGRKSHAIVRQALQVLKNLQHRGACGCEVNTGDGAGILIQMPDEFLRKVAPAPLPPAGEYGVGLVFLPQAAADRAAVEELFARIIAEEGQQLLGWRDVPTDDSPVGPSAVRVEPVFRQVFIGAATGSARPQRSFERHAVHHPQAHRARRRHARASPTISASCFYIVSLSCQTLIYKGMLTASQIETMFPDLPDPDARSRRSRSCTSASAPTRSRRGRWPTRTASSRTTARSTRSPATSTGCARARGCSSRASSATT